MSRKWVSCLAWVALTVFIAANGVSRAHTCLPMPSSHLQDAMVPTCGESDCDCSDGEEHHDADHSSCPCENPHPNKPCCPCPNGCPSCNLAKAPCTALAAPCLELAVCSVPCSFELTLPHLSPFHDALIRPPRA